MSELKEVFTRDHHPIKPGDTVHVLREGRVVERVVERLVSRGYSPMVETLLLTGEDLVFGYEAYKDRGTALRDLRRDIEDRMGHIERELERDRARLLAINVELSQIPFPVTVMTIDQEVS